MKASSTADVVGRLAESDPLLTPIRIAESGEPRGPRPAGALSSYPQERRSLSARLW